MKLYYLEREMELLRRQLWLSEQEYGRLSLIAGPRLSGKKSLVNAVFKDKKRIYIGMGGKSESIVLEDIAGQIKKTLGLYIPASFTTVREAVDFLFVQAASEPLTIIIDGIDEIYRRNRAFYDYLSLKWKKYRRKVNFNLVLTAVSSFAVREMFYEKESPFAGCLDLEVRTDYFSPDDIKTLLDSAGVKYAPEDLLAMYMITGGCPVFVLGAIGAGAVTKDSMIDYFISDRSGYIRRIGALVDSVLGKGCEVYTAILQLIAGGVRTQGAIEEKLGMIVGGHLARLEKEYMLAAKARPLLSDKLKRNVVRYYLGSQMTDFWFRYVEGNRSYVEMEDWDTVREAVRKDFEKYGREVLCRYFLAKFSQDNPLYEIGGDWEPGNSVSVANPAAGRRPQPDPIDIIAIDRKRKKALIVAVAFGQSGFDKGPLVKRTEALRKSSLYGFNIDRRLFTLDDM